MFVQDIASEIWQSINQDSSTSIASISYWVRANLGYINNVLMESFIINDSYEITDQSGATTIPIEAVAIIKQLYIIYDLGLQIRANFSNLNTDSVIEVEDDNSSVRRVDRNQVAKTLASLKKDEMQTLKDLVTAYRYRNSSPKQTVGDDIYGGYHYSHSYNRTSWGA